MIIKDPDLILLSSFKKYSTVDSTLTMHMGRFVK